MTIWIIGYGQFWKFIHTLCAQYLPDTDATPLEQVCNCDVVFPCMPISRFEESMEQILPLLWPDTIVREVCTVKHHPYQVLSSYPDLKYICSHPMFWPESYKKKWNSLQDLRLVMCGHTLDTDIYTKITHHLAETGLVVIQMTPDEHDQQLAQTLFLTHYVSQIVYQADFHRTDIDTISFGFLMDAVESVKDNAELFYDVRKYNPYCKEVVEKFQSVQTGLGLWEISLG